VARGRAGTAGDPQPAVDAPGTGRHLQLPALAAGWVLFGIACLRARVFPVAISVAIVIGGIAGFSALLAPFGIPLGVAVAALGIWTMRQASRQP
jgi:hypothetical protein